MSSSPFDNGIPELTEVIVPDVVVSPPKPATSAAAPAQSAVNLSAAAPAPKINNDKVPARALTDWHEEKWRQLEVDVREEIAQQVLARIDFVLEQRVRDSLADVLQTAVESLAAEIRQGLHASLEEVIARAVAQEISRLKTTKN
jgi:hypothetical protein